MLKSEMQIYRAVTMVQNVTIAFTARLAFGIKLATQATCFDTSGVELQGSTVICVRMRNPSAEKLRVSPRNVVGGDLLQ